MKNITAVVLCAGEGSRMHSRMPKSLHPVAGHPMLVRILFTLKSAGVEDIQVVIHKKNEVLFSQIASVFSAKVCVQGTEKKGTAQAVLSTLPHLQEVAFIINGDHPLVAVADIKNMLDTFQKESADICIGSFIKENPKGYGRIIRQKGRVQSIAEEDTLTHESQNIKEVNAGLYMISTDCLKTELPQIDNKNSKKEYRLTDIVALSKEKTVATCLVSEDGALGVNTQKDLSFATKKIFTRKLNQLMSEGVIVVDPLNTYVEDTVAVGQGSVLHPGVYLKGNTAIGVFSVLEPSCFIVNSVVQQNVLVRAGSYLEGAEVGMGSTIGPYARLRPGTKVGKQCRIGNFVEMKKTQFGAGSKAGHLSYLGDAEIGEGVNIGSSVVTCNLNADGKKYKTRIGNKVFVGSGVQIVAPVELKEGSFVGAGSVITKDVPAGALAVERATQKTVENYLQKKQSKR